MKWYFYIFLLFAFGCKQAVVVTEEEIGSDVFYAHESYTPFTGKCVVLYSNTDLVKAEFRFKNGVLNGQSQAWYKNGKIRRKGCYDEGRISGKWTFWDEQGNKTVEAGYKNDLLDGLYLALYTNGKIKEKGHFKANKKTGRWIYYSENGQLLRNNL